MLIDCFLFFNELELLEIRLYELAPVVGGFVLCESPTTHSGAPKNLVFDENKDQFKKYNIKHLIVDLPHKGECTREQAIANEAHQRNHLISPLDKFDVMMLSDVDEIPSREIVAKAKAPLKILHLMSYFYINLMTDIIWPGTMIETVRNVTMPERLRESRWQSVTPKVVGGWHFGYLGGAQKVKEKLQAFSHVEFKDTTDDEIQDMLINHKDLPSKPGREQLTLKRVENPKNLPHLILEQPERFTKFVC